MKTKMENEYINEYIVELPDDKVCIVKADGVANNDGILDFWSYSPTKLVASFKEWNNFTQRNNVIDND